jgi:hypothetical protein
LHWQHDLGSRQRIVTVNRDVTDDPPEDSEDLVTARLSLSSLVNLKFPA